MRAIGREPAQWGMLVNVVAAFIFAFIVRVTPEQQGWIMAVVYALIGVVVAASTHDGLSAAILGLAKAAVSLAVGLGVHWSPEQQSIVLSFVAIVTGMFVRTQVAAKVPPQT